jgi:hypothetical protein
MDLAPLKITIGLKMSKDRRGKERRVHAYPPFNEIPEAMRDRMDWSHFVDQHGGWMYDKVRGHNEEDAESPRGVWHGLLLVPEDFANEAAKRWPQQCEIINEVQAERFYHARVTVLQPEINEDPEVLQIIAAKRQAGIPESEDDKAAMDPDNPRRGRTKNKLKNWSDMLAHKGLKIAAKHRKPQP